MIMSLIAAPKTFNLDIALVKLAWPVKLNNMVNVVCLPREDDVFTPGTECVTAGWGHTIEGGHKSRICDNNFRTFFYISIINIYNYACAFVIFLTFLTFRHRLPVRGSGSCRDLSFVHCQ